MDFSAPVGGAKRIELCEAKNQNSTDENALKPSNLKLGIRLAVYVPIMPQATRELAPAKIGQKTKATDLGERMNQHDQMRKALRNNIRGFFNEETGRFKFVLLDAECHGNWKEMMLIPNLSDEVIDSVLAAERAPLVRLADEDIEVLRQKTFSTNNPFCPCDSKTMRKAANAIMDAMIAANK